MNFKFKPENSPGFLLWQLTNQWQRKQRQALATLGLTHPQFVVLAAILWLSAQADNEVTQNQVAEFSKIDKMSMSDLTATLVKKKMLKRSKHKEDARAYSLKLTERGRYLVLKAIPIVEEIDIQFFSHETPQLKQLLQSLQHLV